MQGRDCLWRRFLNRTIYSATTSSTDTIVNRGAQCLGQALHKLRTKLHSVASMAAPLVQGHLGARGSMPLEPSLPAFLPRLFAEVAAIGGTFPVAVQLGGTAIDTPTQAKTNMSTSSTRLLTMGLLLAVA